MFIEHATFKILLSSVRSETFHKTKIDPTIIKATTQ